MIAAIESATKMADLGYLIVPIPPGEKYPKGLSAWQKEATSDIVKIEGWLTNGYDGIGWMMGTQNNGLRLIGVDVDVSDGKQGKANLNALLKQWGPEVQKAFRSTVTARTGTGGYHFIFELPPEAPLLTNGKLCEFVDTRGEGGFLVAAPTIHPNGEPYKWVDGKEPWALMPAIAPTELIEALSQPRIETADIWAPSEVLASIQSSDRRHLSLVSDDTPADWARANLSINSMLFQSGWTQTEVHGTDVSWCRPGKAPRDGNSAIVHNDEHFVVWSTNAPAEFWRCGKDNKDGSRSLSPIQVFAAIEHFGDVSKASSDIRKRLMPRPEPAIPARQEGSTVEADAPSMNLPPEFWESRPMLEHIRDAAWSMSCSPDAVLGAVLARYSANVHPSIMLPGWGTLDFFAVIEGHSGGYKSKAGKTARMLYAGSGDSAVMMDRNVGSGEGLAEAFFEWRDEDGHPCSANKKGAMKVRTRWGLHFATDESTALTATAGRAGSIIVPTMCSAWMGEAIGQMLADPTKSRMIEPHKVRVSAELKIQTTHGWKLFREEYADTGLSQRMVCFHSLDTSVYERHLAGIAPPAWPGELRLPNHFVLAGGVPRIMELAPEITAHLAHSAAAGHDPNWAGDPLDTHADLSRLKIAGLLALMDDRFAISVEDWDIAESVLLSHRLIRSMLANTRSDKEKALHVTRVTAEVEKEVLTDEAKYKALLRGAVSAIEGRIKENKPLGKKYMSKRQREVYEEAMALLEAQGVVVDNGEGGWVAVGG